MALHDSIRELVSVRGASVVDEAEEFRGALDDFLAEDEATLGELNLLVDAVRLGALRRVLEVMNHGADPEAAVREAGASLARDRGTDDPTRSCWALAVLAFALGKVDGSMVRLFRGDSGTMSAPDAPRGPLPSPAISGTGTAERPNTEVLGNHHSGPTSAPVPPAAPQPVSVQPPPAYVGPVPPVIPEERSSRAGIFLLVVLVALILGGLVAAGLILLGDDDPTASDDPTPGGGGTGGQAETLKPLVPTSAMLVPYDDGGDARIYEVDVFTSEFEELTDGPRDALPALTPDRRTMTFQEGPAPFVTQVVDLASDEMRPLFDSAGPCSHSGRPAWSPDGSRIAVLCTGEDKDPDGIWLADADGTVQPEPIVDSPLVQGSPTWVSPTRFVYGAREDEDEESPVSFWSIDIDEQVPTRLEIDIDSTLHLSHVDWSQADRRLLFLASPPDAENAAGDIWTMGVDGSNATMLADGTFAHPVWSPDGEAIGVTWFQGDGTEVLAYIPFGDPEEPVVIADPPRGKVGVPVWDTR